MDRIRRLESLLDGLWDAIVVIVTGIINKWWWYKIICFIDVYSGE